jgi:hypothetical protein
MPRLSELVRGAVQRVVASVRHAERNTGRTTRRDDQPTRAVEQGVRVEYRPALDGDPDPGEVVWTWVAYEDDPAQGKDRPVVVIGSLGADLAVVPLSSRDRDGAEWVPVGTGAWDGRQRPSYADTGRVLRVASADVRREGAQLGRDRFDEVVAVVRRHHPTTG